MSNKFIAGNERVLALPPDTAVRKRVSFGSASSWSIELTTNNMVVVNAIVQSEKSVAKLLRKIFKFKRPSCGQHRAAAFSTRAHDGGGNGGTPVIEDYGKYLSKKAALREPALTRQITSLAYKVGKELISLAEGMPNEEVFPFSKLTLELKDGENLVLQGQELAMALQYIPSQGLPGLLQELRKFEKEQHAPPPWVERDILVTTGSQDGLYKTVDLFLDPGDAVLVQTPTYNGISIVLKPYRPEVIEVPEDDDGTVPEVLESVLEERLARGAKMPKLMYLVPTGSNPSGAIIPEHRRRRIYELACRYDFMILEDDPYVHMNYTGVPVPSFLSLDVSGRVVRTDSLSKVLSAGLRAGWLSAPAPLLARLELHAQSAHLHSSTLSQAILKSLFSLWGSDGLLTRVRAAGDLYRRRRDKLHKALSAHCTGLADWRPPRAGMFFWLKINGIPDAYHMAMHTAFERGLMLVPGQACIWDTSAPCPYLRLAFSKVKEEDMDEAARLLADLIRDEQRRVCTTQSHYFATQR